MKFTPHTVACIIPLAALAATAVPSAAQAKKPWSLSLESAIQYDDNITVDQTDTSTGLGDEAALLDLSAGYKIIDKKSGSLEIGYDFSQSLHRDLTNFDIQSHALSASGSVDVGKLTLGASYSFYHLLLGGSGFLDMHMANPSISGFLSSNVYVRGSYIFFDKSFKTSPSRDATNHQPGIDAYYFFDNAKGYVSAGGNYELEQATGAEFDYHGYALRASIQLPLEITGRGGKIKAGYTYLKRNYSNVTPSIGVKRRENRSTFRAEADIPVVGKLMAVAKYRYVMRNSNLPSADYTENVVSGGLKYEF